MGVFSKKVPQPTQEKCVGATLATIAQVMMQMNLQGIISAAEAEVLWPIIINSCHRSLNDRKQLATLVQILEFQFIDDASLKAAIPRWCTPNETLDGTLEPKRRDEIMKLFEELNSIFPEIVSPMMAHRSSLDAIMERSYQAAFAIFEHYFSQVADEHGGLTPIYSGITNLLASSLVLFVNDSYKSILSDSSETVKLRCVTTASVLAVLAVLFAVLVDDVKLNIEEMNT
jgi:hypothetical protein